MENAGEVIAAGADAGSEALEAVAAGANAAAAALQAGVGLGSDGAEAVAVAAGAAAGSASSVGSMALQGIRIFGNVALVASFLAAIGTIIADGVTGAKQKSELVE